MTTTTQPISQQQPYQSYEPNDNQSNSTNQFITPRIATSPDLPTLEISHYIPRRPPPPPPRRTRPIPPPPPRIKQKQTYFDMHISSSDTNHGRYSPPLRRTTAVQKRIFRNEENKRAMKLISMELDRLQALLEKIEKEKENGKPVL